MIHWPVQEKRVRRTSFSWTGQWIISFYSERTVLPQLHEGFSPNGNWGRIVWKGLANPDQLGLYIPSSIVSHCIAGIKRHICKRKYINSLDLDCLDFEQLIPPLDQHLVSPVPLDDAGLLPGGLHPSPQHFPPSLSCHSFIVNTERHVCGG